MRWIALIVSVACAGPRLAYGDSPSTVADPVALVRQLGEKKFADREAAEQKLLALGSKAKPAVRAGVGSRDPEISQRCQGLVSKIRAAERDAFLEGKLDWPGPVGRKFRELVGDGEESRKLFGEVLKVGACCDVLERLTDSPDEAPKAYAAEVGRVQQAWRAALSARRTRKVGNDTASLRQESEQRVAPGEVVLVLVLDSFRKAEDAGKPVRPFEVFAVSFMELTRGPYRQPFRKLFLTWLNRQSEAGDLVDGLNAALYASVSEAVPVARRVLKDPKVSINGAGWAILLLGNHGEKADAVQISVFRNDSRVYLHGKGPNGDDRDVLIRDIAAAMSLKLRGRDAEDFGFDMSKFSTWWSDAGSYQGVTAFRTAADRDAAHKKAWAWLDE